MKKAFVSVLLLLFIMLCACTGEAAGNQVASDGIKEDKIEKLNAMDNLRAEEHYDVYELDVADSAFNLAIRDNELDAAYRLEIDSATTTDELIQVEQKYISIWEAELRSSIEKYISVLSEEDVLAFEKSQALFEKYCESSTLYDENMLLQGKYDIALGTASRWLLYVNKKDIIRDRTIHIKYLHYIIERASEYPQKIFSALTFHKTEDDS